MRWLRVEKEKGEEVRKTLIAKSLLDPSRRIVRSEEWLLFPVRCDESLEEFGSVEEFDLEAEKPAKARSLREALKGLLTEAELRSLRRAYDVVGDVAILEIPQELVGKEKVIAEALLRTFKHIKVVAKRASAVKGKFRVRKVKWLAGQRRLTTIHKEHGCSYFLDLKSVYFTPRLANERKRVAEQVVDGERVLVMFAGVGPYPILISKLAKMRVIRCEVVAVELNSKAYECLLRNIKLNRVKVEAHLGDVREVVPRLEKFKRIIMPLPKGADHFLDIAFLAIKRGGVVHFYTFSEDEKGAKSVVEKVAKSYGRPVEVLRVVKCGSYSPRLSRYCVDFRVL